MFRVVGGMEQRVDFLQFDWSGTISDDRMPVFTANMRMCDFYGIEKPSTFADWIKTTTKGVQDWFLERGAMATRDEIWEQYTTNFRTVISEGKIPTIYEDVSEVLRMLKDQGKKLAVVSSHPQENVRREAEEYGVAHYFEEIVGTVIEKADGIRELCGRLDINLSRTAYVGDMVHDIAAAKKAQVLPIAVSRGYHSEEVLRENTPFALWQDLRPAIHL